MLYFDHDTSASTDQKLMQLRLECGGAAVDAYWYLVEQMHREERAVCVGNAGAMRVHCHTLCTDERTLREWVSTMLSTGLLEASESGDEVYSNRALFNINEYQAKKEKASSAAKSRWSNADAKQPHKRTQSERNADAMLRKEKKRNSSNATKSITTTKQSGAAEAAEAAAPDCKKPVCPMCEVEAWKDNTGYYHCPNCHDQFTKDKVGWR